MIGALVRVRSRLRELHLAGLVRVELAAEGLPPCVVWARRPTARLLADAWNVDPRRRAVMPARVDEIGALAMTAVDLGTFLSVTISSTDPEPRAVLVSYLARVLLFLLPG